MLDLQSLQIASLGHPHLLRLLAVRILLWSNVQAKNQHLGSVLAF